MCNSTQHHSQCKNNFCKKELNSEYTIHNGFCGEKFKKSYALQNASKFYDQ